MSETVGNTPIYSRRELNRMAQLLLKAARLLMENGAESRRVFETVRGMSKALGLEQADILISHRSVMLTVASGDEAVTRIIRVGTLGVNMEKIAEMSRVFRRVSAGETDAKALETALADLSSRPSPYPAWLALPMGALACGGFCMISGGDARAFAACVLAALAGLYLRKIMFHAQFQPMLGVFSAAFLSASLATLLTHFFASGEPAAGVAASVLYLVPGVPMINAVADLVKGHLMTGLARALTVVLTAAFVASGLVLAMKIWGFSY